MEDNVIVCECLKITYGELKDAKNSGCYSVDAIVQKTGAGTACRQCKSLEDDKSFRRKHHIKEDVLES